MKFLLDVHIAGSVGRALTRDGHDVLYAIEQHATCSDEELLALACAGGRVLLTEDRDFSDLIYRRGAQPPRAVVYLRCGAADQVGMAERVLLVLANTSIDGHMTVIQRTSVRHRPLPEKQADHG